MQQELIFIIGMPASGKTTLGAALAGDLGYAHCDTDCELERRLGLRLSVYIPTAGEKSFRQAERALLEHLLGTLKQTVISTGGGLPCFYDNIDSMNQAGITLWLAVSTQTIIQRLFKDPLNSRPLFAGMNEAALAAKVEDLIRLRTPYYSKAQLHYRVDDGEPISTTLLNVKNLLNNRL